MPASATRWTPSATAKGFLALASLILAGVASADQVDICYNYDCGTRATVIVDGEQLLKIRALFKRAKTPEAEREAISQAIGQFEAVAGQQTPTRNDKGGNADDDGVDGRMDCLDHSHNTTEYLKLMEYRGWLKYHKVRERVMRAPYIVNDHWAARIEETETGREYIVDSWFFDSGQPAAVFTLEEWKAGASPNER